MGLLTGRLCPAPCEEACTLKLADQPVTIKAIEHAIAEVVDNRCWYGQYAKAGNAPVPWILACVGTANCRVFRHQRDIHRDLTDNHRRTFYRATKSIGGTRLPSHSQKPERAVCGFQKAWFGQDTISAD